MDVTDFMGSSDFLKSEDLKGKTVFVKIKGVHTREFDNNGKPQDKLVLELHDKDKMVVLNVTNTRTIAGAFGTETDNWVGKKVMLGVRETPLGPGIAVNIAPGDDFDDDIPF